MEGTKMTEENPKIGSGVIAIGAGLLGYVAGYLTKNIVAEQIEQPGWAKEAIAQVYVERMGQVLRMEYVGTGGWTDNQGTHQTANYIGWRETGVGKGDSDAWIGIEKRADGSIRVGIFGTDDLNVGYGGVRLTQKSGAFLYTSY